MSRRSIFDKVKHEIEEEIDRRKRKKKRKKLKGAVKREIKRTLLVMGITVFLKRLVKGSKGTK